MRRPGRSRLLFEGDVREREEPGPAAPLPAEDPIRERVTALQRASGNRAVAQLLREADGSPSAALGPPSRLTGLPPSLSLPSDYVERRQAETEGKIREYLERERPRIQGRIVLGQSIAELVDLVRTNVPEALSLAPSQIADVVRRFFAPLTIAEHRKPDDKEGKKSELVASLRNAMSKIPTELGIENKQGWAKITASGAEVGVKAGELEASAEVGWDKSIGVSTEIPAGPGKVKFAASIEPPGKAGDPVKWEISLAFVEGGGGAPSQEHLADVIGKGERGLRSALAEARKLGDASPSAIKEAFAPVKEALNALAKLVGAEGATIGISVEGEGPDVKVQATIKVSF